MNFGDWFDPDEHDMYNYPCESMETAWNAAIKYHALTPAKGLPIKDRVWMLMDSQPESGSFLVYLPEERKDDRYQVAVNHPNIKTIGKCFDFDLTKPTHWMPLPSPPITEKDNG